MAKKKKSNSAQDLIDSLLDEAGSDPNRRPAPQAPALPEHVLKKAVDKDEESFGDISFDVDPAKAQPTRTLHLVQEGEANTAEMRRAATVVQGGQVAAATGSSSQSGEFGFFDLPPGEAMANEPNATPGSDKTVRIPATDAISVQQSVKQQAASEPKYVPKIPDRPPQVENELASQLRYKIQSKAQAVAASPTEAALKQSESLRAAQARIHELEDELDRLRRESEKLASAGETLRRRTDELLAKSEGLESQVRETQKTTDEEKKIMRAQLNSKDREILGLRTKLEEAETRLESNFKKIRVRERELEHRLEIIKMESQTLVSTKDDMIMRLKREIDQMKFEIENGKVRSQELYNQYQAKQETARRVVRALRIALTILEGEEDGAAVVKGLYTVTVTKTIECKARELFEYLISEVGQAEWLRTLSPIEFTKGAQFEIAGGIYGEVRTMKPGKSLRMTWIDEDWDRKTILQVFVIDRPKGRSMLVIDHSDVPTARGKEALRERWRAGAEKVQSHFA